MFLRYSSLILYAIILKFVYIFGFVYIIRNVEYRSQAHIKSL